MYVSACRHKHEHKHKTNYVVNMKKLVPYCVNYLMYRTVALSSLVIITKTMRDVPSKFFINPVYSFENFST